VGVARLGPWFQDGTSNTIAFSEAMAQRNGGNYGIAWGGDSGNWCGYADNPAQPCFGSYLSNPYGYPQFGATPATAQWYQVQGFGSYGILVSLCDGSVRNVTQGVSTNAWTAAMTPQGGEVIDSTW
jgi:hypothetical protein